MTETIDPPENGEGTIARAMMRGDLRGLSKDGIAGVVAELARRMGVDPALAPIDVIQTREGKLVPYINARGAAELRKRHGLEVVGMEVIKDRPGLVVMRATVRDPEGRTDMGVGACAYPEDRPREEEKAWMVAETRAKRRATMSAVGIFLEAPSDDTDGE